MIKAGSDSCKLPLTSACLTTANEIHLDAALATVLLVLDDNFATSQHIADHTFQLVRTYFIVITDLLDK